MKATHMRPRPILSVLAGFVLFAPAWGLAAPPFDPAATVTAFVAGLGRMTRDTSLSASDREREFAGILSEDCDLPRIAGYTLGSYAATASIAERQQFDGLFQRWVTHIFADRLGGFDAASFSVKSVATANNGAIVSSEIADGIHPIRIEWRVSADDGSRIVDVAMEGISIAAVEREEMGAVLRRNGGTVADLNRALAVRLASDDGATPPSAVAAATTASAH